VLKQLKTLDQWQGLLVHRGIEKLVVPLLSQDARPNWDQIIADTVSMAKRQREFSRERKYRDPAISKTKAGDESWFTGTSTSPRYLRTRSPCPNSAGPSRTVACAFRLT
jgi:hypothetical protein